MQPGLLRALDLAVNHEVALVAEDYYLGNTCSSQAFNWHLHGLAAIVRNGKGPAPRSLPPTT
jgi:hypothetical protein